MRRTLTATCGALATCIAVAGCQSAPRPGAETRAPAPQDREAAIRQINFTIDDFHDAAAVADIDRYFGHLTAQAVFLGTDAWERWPREEFRAYCAPHFLGESAWAYTPRDRNVALSDSGDTAWFDETVVNEKYGSLRGSGVIVLCSDGVWRIAQYNLGFTVPNEIAGKIVEMIKATTADAAR
ncbi:MAG: nuclear transport factor 2 family protein [Phycisphaeraceae bacterium]|nr:nuclear transport factor 2 family protein [Phycisphaeraceae bacterium]